MIDGRRVSEAFCWLPVTCTRIAQAELPVRDIIEKQHGADGHPRRSRH